jgi:hypothetical protein
VADEKIARATIVLYDGAEQPFADELEVLLQARSLFGSRDTAEQETLFTRIRRFILC